MTDTLSKRPSSRTKRRLADKRGTAIAMVYRTDKPSENSERWMRFSHVAKILGVTDN
jgi:hypothetical protein